MVDAVVKYLEPFGTESVLQSVDLVRHHLVMLAVQTRDSLRQFFGDLSQLDGLETSFRSQRPHYSKECRVFPFVVQRYGFQCFRLPIREQDILERLSKRRHGRRVAYETVLGENANNVRKKMLIGRLLILLGRGLPWRVKDRSEQDSQQGGTDSRGHPIILRRGTIGAQKKNSTPSVAPIGGFAAFGDGRFFRRSWQ